MSENNHVQPPMQPAALHLTDAQFTDLLLGTIPPAVIAHLESCPQCAEESQRVAGAIGSFAQQSRLWAERRAAAQRPTRRAPFAWLGIPIGPLAWVAATLMLVAGFSLLRRAQHPASAPQTTQAVAVIQPAPAAAPATAGVTPASLKADNELLSAIDGELTDTDSSGVQTNVQTYLTVGSHSARTHSAKGLSN
jgi:hypothetical protein